MKLVPFKDVWVGQKFYDPACAEWFVKRDEIRAANLNGLGKEVFGSNEMVEIDDDE